MPTGEEWTGQPDHHAGLEESQDMLALLAQEERRRVNSEENPLLKAYAGLTPGQKSFVLSKHRARIVCGGNRSGKTFSNIIDFLLQALGIHPAIHWPPAPQPVNWSGGNWMGWYATKSYEMFGLQAWQHFKRLLLYPGESELKLPTRNILDIGWHSHSPQIPNFFRLRRGSVQSEIWVKSYEQGPSAFQSGGVDCLSLDEECDQAVFDESQLRIPDRMGHINVSATPVIGVEWLDDLEKKAQVGDPGVFFVRISMRDNPAVGAGEIQAIERQYAEWPAMAKLRLEGYPMAEEGKIYPDSMFQPSLRVIAPFPIPDDWTLYRCIDHGVHVVACLWLAVAPGRKKIVLYREYYGEDVEPVIGNGRTDRGNACNIWKLSLGDGGQERYERALIDRATLGSGQETGTRLIDLWRKAKVRVEACPDNRVEGGIEQVKQMLLEKAPDGSYLFAVFDTCKKFLWERQRYGRKPVRDKGDEGKMGPIKRDDHLMDCWKYLVSAGIEYKPVPLKRPPEGSLGDRLIKKRRESLKSKVKL